MEQLGQKQNLLKINYKMNNRTYVIIEAGDVSGVDFSQVLETSADTLKYNNDETKTFVKYEGSQPSFLNGKTTYTHTEILAELAKEDWVKELP
tara:strand:- start:93 stop:371 length:279 start_codon:yes stop_codon:yes gene_type:complete